MSLLTSLAIGSVLMIVIIAGRYVAVSGFFAWLTTRTGRDPHRDATRRAAQVRREIGWSLLSAAIYGVPAGIVGVLWHERGWTMIYADPTMDAGALGLLWLPTSVLVYLFVHDTYFYWSHRWMHRPAVFQRVHAVHHDSRPPTAWAAMSFHPWEALSGAVVIPGLAFVVPIQFEAMLLVLAVMTFNGVTNHMGWELYPRSWLDGWWGRTMITASHHHLHHRHYRCNYGLYFRFWDRLCGTDRGWASELDHEVADAALARLAA